MQTIAKTATMASMICVGMFLASSAVAQSPTTATVQDPMTSHHVRQYQLMKDMTDEMSAMTAQMARGELTVEERKQMAQRMALMASIMNRMSGLEARPAMKEVDFERQMVEMRRQMDAMMRKPADIGSKGN